MIKSTIAVALALGLAGAAAAQDSVEENTVSAFRGLDAGGNFTLRFEPSDTPMVRLEGDGDDFEDIDVDTDGDRLEIRQDGGALSWFGRRRNLDVTVIVSGPGVETFEFSRGIDANLSGIALDDISLHVSTGADTNINGRCGSARIHVSTGANLDGRNFVCESIRAHASTGADMSIAAEAELVAHASTGGDIRSVTEPANLRVHTSTGGDVHVRRHR
ncbi:MAG: hypothetical protein DHS20C06_08650 [Hyphobacterium sp.]|nr:MAG: hypothetical protein DHS20C06_08650 [Hyphobacterium sp.]